MLRLSCSLLRVAQHHTKCVTSCLTLWEYTMWEYTQRVHECSRTYFAPKLFCSFLSSFPVLNAIRSLKVFRYRLVILATCHMPHAICHALRRCVKFLITHFAISCTKFCSFFISASSGLFDAVFRWRVSSFHLF